MGSYRYTHGVTLVEILVVVATIALLATIVIAVAVRIDNQSKERGLKSTFTLLDSALREYYEYAGKFPVQPERSFANAVAHSELLHRQLSSLPVSRQILVRIGTTLRKNVKGTDLPEIYDPWGTVLDYAYVSGDSFPQLISAGPDKAFGTGDDITSRGE